MSGITWLHLSDWHQKGSDFERQVVRDALLRDIQERAKIDPNLAHIDFIVFSGDLAFSGRASEYIAARKFLLDPVLQVTDQEPQRLFFVPGNHDLNRETAYEMLPSSLLTSFDSDEEVENWLGDAKKRVRALEPFDSFRAFVSSYTGQPTPDYASTLTLDLQGKKIALLGLNSAWMTARSNGSDYWRVVVGEHQIQDCLAKTKNAELRIAVTHHPIEWLAPFERNTIKALLQQTCQFILHGHEHSPQLQIAHDILENCITIPAGATYERRTGQDTQFINSYNYVHLDVDDGTGTVFLRTWSNQSNKWVLDFDAQKNGRLKFSYPTHIQNKKRLTPSDEREDSRVETNAKNIRRFSVLEERYKRNLRESNNIINFANLPDIPISGKQQRDPTKNSLYIPLRLSAEELNGDNLINKMNQHVPVGNLLAPSRRLVILGNPGSGKSTLIRWISTAHLLRPRDGVYSKHYKDLPDIQTLPEENWLPIPIRCRDLDSNYFDISIDDVLKRLLMRLEVDQSVVEELNLLLQTRLKDGRALLMFDGLDEIAETTARLSFCRLVDDLAEIFPRAPIIVTSRAIGYRELGYTFKNNFEHYALDLLSEKDKDNFVRRWCKLTEPPEQSNAAARELIVALHSDMRIEQLTNEPLLLTSLMLVMRRTGRLPTRRADLYSDVLQVLLNWRKELTEPLDTREVIPQLEYLAYAMCDRGIQQLSHNEAIVLLTRIRQEYPNIYTLRNRSPEEFLRLLTRSSEIMIDAIGNTYQQQTSLPAYEFRHLALQEYFAARALVDGRFPGRDPKKNLAEHVASLAGRTAESISYRGKDLKPVATNSWIEPLRLCSAICSDDDVDKVLLAIVTPQERDAPSISFARTILATLCLADEPNVSEQLGEHILRQFAHTLTSVSTPSKIDLNLVTKDLTRSRWGEYLHALV